MRIDIRPMVGAGEFTFGMKKTDIHAKFSEVPTSFKWASESTNSDYFRTEGIFFYYNDIGFLEAIEFASPAQPMIGGVDIMSLNYQGAIDFFSKIDDETTVEADAVTSPKLGVSIWAPLTKEDSTAPIESVLVSRN